MQTHFLPLLEKLSDQRILCIGDVMLDRYVFGRAERISPEAPIPVLHILRRADKLGGCGNTVDNIASLNGKVSMIGVVGKDRARDRFDENGCRSSTSNIPSHHRSRPPDNDKNALYRQQPATFARRR